MMEMQKHMASDAHSRISRWYSSVNPQVSIVILNFNKSELTLNCLEHIWRHTHGVTYEIIVVDNGSRPDEFSKLASEPGYYRLIRLPKNRFYGEGNNIGVEHAVGNFICLLNNDAFVTEDWLTPLCEVLEGAWAAGAVGPRFVYPDGRLQEVGSFIDTKGYSHQVGKFSLYNRDDIVTTRVVDYCSAACLLVRRADFLRVGGFDLVYEPAYYEDVDLCFKLRELKLFTYCCPKCLIVHVENATTATHRNVLGEQTVERNRERFVSRWKSYLSSRNSGDTALADEGMTPDSLPFHPPAASDGKRPKVAFYTAYDLTPGGGERYLLSAAAAVSTIADVFLVTESPYSQVRMASLSRELTLDLTNVRVTSISDLFAVVPIDVCIVMSNEILPPIKGFGRFNYYLCQFPFPINDVDLSKCWSHIDSIDEYICYSNFVRMHVSSEYERIRTGTKPINVLAPPVPQFNVGCDLVELKAPIKILTIGRFFVGGHNKRHDVVIEAVKRLLSDGIDVELHLAGSVVTSHAVHAQHLANLKRSAEGLPIYFHVNASSNQITSVLQECVIYAHAAGFEVDATENPQLCEHFGISVLEAMSAGCLPLVVDNGGPAEFIKDEFNGFTYSSLDEMVGKIKNVLSNRTKFDELRSQARVTAATFSQEKFDSRWIELVSPHLIRHGKQT